MINAKYLTTVKSPSVPQTPGIVKAEAPDTPVPKTPHTPMGLTSTVPDTSATTLEKNPFEASLSSSDSKQKHVDRPLRQAKLLDEGLGPIAIIYYNVLRYIDCQLLDLITAGERVRDKKTEHHQTPGDAQDGEEGSSVQGDDVESAETEAQFEFMANCIWKPIAKLVMGELGSVLFAAGRVAELHQVSLSFRTAFNYGPRVQDYQIKHSLLFHPELRLNAPVFGATRNTGLFCPICRRSPVY